MSSATDRFGPFCGALGCRSAADVVIRHTEHGKRTVCEEHAGDDEVVRDV
ncbi:hypothetical protein ACFQGT_10645 [Natrialbaceae archaeon GCM10025810]